MKSRRVPIERPDRPTVRDFLSWVHDRAIEDGGRGGAEQIQASEPYALASGVRRDNIVASSPAASAVGSATARGFGARSSLICGQALMLLGCITVAASFNSETQAQVVLDLGSFVVRSDDPNKGTIPLAIRPGGHPGRPPASTMLLETSSGTPRC